MNQSIESRKYFINVTGKSKYLLMALSPFYKTISNYEYQYLITGLIVSK